MKNRYQQLVFKGIFVAISFFLSFQSNAQTTTEQCLSGIIHQRLMSTDSAYAAQMTANENVLQSAIADFESGARMMPTSYRIPVVVHIMHLGEAVGTGTNISDAQIYSAIRTLNEAYRKKSGTEFFGNGVDTGIEFCLAQKDATGNPSTGILRINASGTSDYATNGLTTAGTTNEATIKALSKWNNTKYYNIWVVSEIDGNNGGAGVQGFAYFPGASATYDGAVMLYNCFGYDPTGVYGYNLKSYTNRNKTLIHEMGHALNLYHTFEGDGTGATCPTNTNCNTQGDRCCDIPPHKRSNSTCVADATANTCLAGSTALDFQHNYMDYSADVCTNMFTANQLARMAATLATGGTRASLATAANLTACGCSIPIPLFSANPVNPCLGIPVQFTDESLNFPTSWAWTFTGATPPSATTQNPTTTYNSAGAYNVSLQATSAAGVSTTLTKTAYINPVGSSALPFVENFEGATFPPTGWSRVSGDAPSVAWGTDGIHQWERRPAAGNTGSTAGSAAMNMFNYNLLGPPIDNLISKPVSLAAVTSSTMTFKVSYKNYPAAANYDSLKVFVSTDCGNTYGAAVYSKFGTTLATSGALSTTFTPSAAADWRTETVSLTPYIGQTVIVKFVSYSNYGNNLYIDDVNITGVSGTVVASVVIAETAGTNPMCAGASATFTATPTNGGTTPTYQWQINGVNVGGATASTFTTTTLANGNIVTCIMTSSLSGVTGSPATSNSITMTVNPLPATPTATNTGPYCAGATITLATPTVAGATYAWSGPGGYTSAVQNPTRPTSTVAMAGTYSVTVTSAAGCTSLPGTTTVVVNALPATPTASNTGPYCAGATITLSTPTVAGATYAWSGPSGYTSAVQNPTRPTSTVAMSGTYSVTVTVGGCASAAGTTAVVVNAIPATPTVGSSSPDCVGSTISLTSNTIAGATYSWTGPSAFTSALEDPTRPSATAAMAGTYSLTVTVGGCTSAAATTAVVINALPATPTASNTGPYCAGATITLSTPTVAGSTYAWSGPGGYTSAVQNPTRPTSTVAMAGTYSVTVTNASGCTSLAGTTTVVVNALPATPTASNTGPYCAGATIALSTPTVATATYAWSGPSGYTSAVQNPTRPASTVAMSGTYSITVTVGGCTSLPGTTAVVVNTAPAAPTVGSSTPDCVGSTISLTSNTIAGATYSWTGPSAFTSALEDPTRPSATAAMAGTYSLTVTVGGCTSAAATTTVVINALPATPTASNTGPYCAGATISLSTPTVGGATYAWSGPGGYTAAIRTPTIAASTTAMSGTYSVTITNASGCTSLAGTTTVVVNPIPATPIASNTGPYCVGATINLATPTVATATYAWTGPSTFTSATQNPTRPSATVAMAGTYSVTVTVSGCTSLAGTTTVAVSTTVVPTNSIVASPSGAICAGTSVTFNTTIGGGGTTPAYQWQVNGVNVGGATSSSFTSSTLTNGQIVTCILTSGSACASPATATSNAITMVVNPVVTPSVSVVASPTGAVCAGTSVTFTATPTNGGTTPTYQWQVNGTNVGTGGTTYTSTTLSNSDVVTCIMTSTAACPSTATATSGAITMTVNPMVAPTISISIGSGTNPTCSGVPVMFVATTSNGGTTPTYQWQINGSNAGTSLATFMSSTLNNGDVVTCILTSSNACASPASITSAGITMTVDPTPAIPTITQTGAMLTSSSATGNQWYLNGVLIPGATSQNYTFTANGTYTVIVTTGPCSSAASAPTVITTTGITDNSNAYLLNVFPNPNDGNFTITFNVAVKGNYKMELMNALGQVIYKEDLKDYSGTYKKQMSVVDYGKGVYTIILTNEKHEVVKKIVVY